MVRRVASLLTCPPSLVEDPLLRGSQWDYYPWELEISGRLCCGASANSMTYSIVCSAVADEFSAAVDIETFKKSDFLLVDECFESMNALVHIDLIAITSDMAWLG